MAVHPPIIGCGRDANGVDVPIHADNIGQVTGTDSTTVPTAAGAHPFKLCYGRTVGGVNVPIAVSGTGFILFA